MELRVGPFEKRGGVREKTKLRTAQSLLLEALWEKLGGVSAVGEALNTHHQTPINWRLKGKVPLVLCGTVANTLKVDKWALNYSQLKALLGDAPTWKSVVQALKFDSEVETKILKAPEPK